MRMSKTSSWWLVLATLSVAAASGPASAQTAGSPARTTRPAPPPPAAPPRAPATNQAAAPSLQGAAGQGDSGNVKVERGAGGKKIYKITTEIRIEGKIQKPEAFYVLQKSAINYEWQELKQDFTPKILESVTQAPF
jgi:hypothetical protein